MSGKDSSNPVIRFIGNTVKIQFISTGYGIVPFTFPSYFGFMFVLNFILPPVRHRGLLRHDPDADAVAAQYGPGYVTVTVRPLDASVQFVLWRYTVQSSGDTETDQIRHLSSGSNISMNISTLPTGSLVDFEFVPLLKECVSPKWDNILGNNDKVFQCLDNGVIRFCSYTEFLSESNIFSASSIHFSLNSTAVYFP